MWMWIACGASALAALVVVRCHEARCEEYDAAVGRLREEHEARAARLPGALDRHYALEHSRGCCSDAWRALAAWRERPRYYHLLPPPRPPRRLRVVP